MTPDQLKALSQLPDARTPRWTPAKKERVLDAFTCGAITEAEIDRRYGVSSAEFEEWVSRYSTAGLGGLKVTQRAVR